MAKAKRATTLDSAPLLRLPGLAAPAAGGAEWYAGADGLRMRAALFPAKTPIGSVIVSALEDLNLRYPRVDKASKAEFAKVRKALEDERDSEEARRRRPVKKAVGKNLSKSAKSASGSRKSAGFRQRDDAV